MPLVGAGYNHLAIYSSLPENGWRLRAGWELVRIMDTQVRADGTYDMLVHVRGLAGWEHELAWPPITSEPPTEEEATLLAIQEQMGSGSA